MIFQQTGETLLNSLQNIGYGVANFLPAFVGAIIIFIIGWVVGALIGRLVAEIIKAIKVDSALRSLGVEDAVKRAGYDLDSGAFLGALVKWFIIVVFLVVAFNILGLTQVNEFLVGVVLGYLPKVIVAVLILLVSVVIAQAMQRIVVASAKAANVTSANFLGGVTKWSILVVAAITAVSQLGIGGDFLETLFQGIVWALVLIFGLSFGLGGQEAAARYIEKLRQEVADRK